MSTRWRYGCYPLSKFRWLNHYIKGSIWYEFIFYWTDHWVTDMSLNIFLIETTLQKNVNLPCIIFLNHSNVNFFSNTPHCIGQCALITAKRISDSHVKSMFVEWGPSSTVSIHHITWKKLSTILVQSVSVSVGRGSVSGGGAINRFPRDQILIYKP